MVRKLSVAWGPSPTLFALGVLCASRRRARGPGVVHDELRHELGRALAALEPSLAAMAAAVTWLEARAVASAALTSKTIEGPAGLCLRNTELHVDLARLEDAAHDERGGIEGKAHCTLFALRLVLRAASREELFVVSHCRSGGRRVPLADLLREVERAAKRLGFRDEQVAPSRFAEHLGSRKTSTKPETPPGPARVVGAAAREATAPPAQARPKKRAAGQRQRGAPDEGFGGLPDDAVSDAPPAERPRDPDTPGPDGLFFLETAGIDAFPCGREALDRARRSVISRLHPDRAGDESARDFHRAIKGHLELAGILERLRPLAPPPPPSPPPPAVTTPQAPPVPAAAPPAARSPAADAPLTTKRARAARVTRVAPPSPPAAASARGTVNEWPPRPTREAQRPCDADTEFFLQESSVSWPCDAPTLHRAWASLSARLRRMTPASVAAASHARASRGFEALLRAVSEAA